MGFWRDLFFGTDTQEQQERNVPEVTPPVSDVLLKALINNEVITREKALTLPVVSGAVDLIANCIASMPVRLYKYRDGKVEEQDKDSRVKLLNGDTGDTLDAFQLKHAMVEDYLLGKGGYCFINRKLNEVVSLHYVADIYISVLKNFRPIFKDYSILVEGRSYKPYQFVKILRNTHDGSEGVGLTAEVSKALETAYQTLLYQLNLVKSGGNKKGFLKSQRKLGQDEIDILKAAWGRMYSDNSENVVVLNNGLEFQEASFSSVEAQLDQNKNTLEKEIFGIFHIHPENFDLTFKEAIYPIIKAFETALNRDLLLEKEKKNMFFEFDVKEIVKANLQERYSAYKMAKETGFMTLNEIRRAENMEYVEGLDVVNVGLGAVLYDINKHIYYTPNTDTVGDVNDGGSNEDQTQDDQTQEDLDKMLEGHEEVEEYDESGNSAERSLMDSVRLAAEHHVWNLLDSEVLERYNNVHDAKTGRFGSKGSAGGAVDNSARIKELQDELSKTSRFGSGAARRKELMDQINALKGDEDPDVVPKKSDRPVPAEKPESIPEKGMPVTKEKEAQFEIIQKTNPMTDDIHTGIRKPSDIKSAEEAFKTTVDENVDYAYPDFTKADGTKALASGKVTVYSSKPIEQGGFVSPSKMMAQDYAGNGKVYSKEVSVHDVAWIDSNEGQLAKVRNTEERSE